MSNILKGISINEAAKSPERDYSDPSWDEKVSSVGQKAKQAEVLKSKGKEPKTRWNPETKKYYVDFSDTDDQGVAEGNDPFRGVGGAFNRGDDERHDLDPTDWYKVKDGKMFRVSIYPRQVAQAEREGYSRTQAEAKAAAGQQGVEEGAGFDKWANDRAASQLHKLKPATTWEVSYDYGPHMTKTVTVNARSEEEACAKVEKAAEKKGLNIMINSVEQGVAEGIMNTIANKVMGGAPAQPKYKVGQRVKYETSPHQPDWKDGGRGVGVITAYKNGHYMINGNPVNHFEIKGVVDQGVADGSEEKGMAAYRKGAHDAHNDKEETNPYPSGTYDHGSYKSGYRIGLAHKDKEQGVAEGFFDRFKKKPEQPEDPNMMRAFHAAGGYEKDIDVMGWQMGWKICASDPSADPEHVFQKLYYGGGSPVPFDHKSFMMGFNACAKDRGIKRFGEPSTQGVAEGYDEWNARELEKLRTRHPDGTGSKPSNTLTKLQRIPGFSKTSPAEQQRVAKAVDGYLARDMSFDQALVLAQKQGVAEGSEDKIAKHNAAVAKMTKRSFAKLDYNHPDLLKTAPEGYRFSIDHKLVPHKQGVAEAGIPHSNTFGIKSRSINLPSMDTKKYFTDKKQWAQAADDLNHSLYDDNSEFIGVTGRSTVTIDGREWARWSDAQQKGYVETKPLGQAVAEEQLDELSCWSGYHRVSGTKAGFPGSCAKNTNEEQELDEYGDTPKGQKMLAKVHHRAADRVTSKKSDTDPQYARKSQQTQDRAYDRMKDVSEGHHSESCPHCGGEMVSEELMNEKKDACYYKVKSRYKVWPSAYASGALVKCRNKGASNWGTGGKSNESIEEDQLDEKWTKKYKDSINCSNPKGFSQKAHCAGKQKNESSILEGIEQVDENLHKWFKEKWVRFGPDGKIRGDCARGDDSEGKPKCLPQSKAQNLGKKGRASAASRKRREDPNPERSGKAINVNTKKTKE